MRENQTELLNRQLNGDTTHYTRSKERSRKRRGRTGYKNTYDGRWESGGMPKKLQIIGKGAQAENSCLNVSVVRWRRGDVGDKFRIRV